MGCRASLFLIGLLREEGILQVTDSACQLTAPDCAPNCSGNRLIEDPLNLEGAESASDRREHRGSQDVNEAGSQPSPRNQDVSNRGDSVHLED